jgi:hypothetical protein
MSKLKSLPFIIILFLSLIFFSPFFLSGKLPIPADTIIGLYYPYRDLYADKYPRGVPFKNFMITDPIRQQYPWKNLAVGILKKGELPLWNPYTFSGQPLLGNLQSGTFYPLNFIFFLFSFPIAWSLYIFLQPFLGSLFLFLYLNNLKLDKRASIIGSIAFGYGGFAISWLEWGTIMHTAIWLPLILLSLDKIFSYFKNKVKRNNGLMLWLAIFVISLSSSFFAGHLQIFFYILVFSFAYFVYNIVETKNKAKALLSLVSALSVFFVITLIKWIAGVRFIALSGRSIDQDWHTISGWFVPWQNSIQVIIPDFFGNPATLNYWGVWNYGEFISYLGVGAFIFALFALLNKDRRTSFFLLTLVIAILFAFPNIIAKIPFKFSFPFISTSQPTRLIFIIDFSLSVLAAFGLDFFLKTNDRKKIIYILGIILCVFSLTWIYTFTSLKNVSLDNFLVSKSNLILPTALFILNGIIVLLMVFLTGKNKYIKAFNILVILLVSVLFLDLLRFGWKYTPFTNSEYLYPNTKVLSYLKKNLGNHRIMASDSRIFPPNFSIMYKIQSIDGYDPLYLENYAEFSAALERGSPDIHKPFGFNRIITPQNYHTRVIDLLGVKYVLSLTELSDENLEKVFSEGNTIVYRNIKVFPRTFFVSEVKYMKNKQDQIDFIYKELDGLRSNAVVEDNSVGRLWYSYLSKAEITNYEENKIEIQTENKGDGFLVLTDNYYPTWHAKVDGKETKVYLTDYTFRGVIVPKGSHKVVFYNSLF